ncbi:MAG: YdbL family protein [Gammaproteobacteria bacterium]|jgi:hypothetical protein|nr:YdbL family protein [Gammaproteobacteria bacterium]MBT3488867.1 YdbL family protein [Gammaproteobacteria bacterium]MBT3719323.1 YdbL family protein [Gammaproteobacteria bacterium]MBT3844501.1 YdbL family protein [Gammaproteobacteria bacterium]MBT3891955.1 YdbL family protein [Gammaproteobacteria bacterium]
MKPTHQHSKKLFALILTLLCSTSLYALDLSEARNRGIVGENSEGLLVARSKNMSVLSLVEEINHKRLNKYRHIAEKNNLTITTVGQRMAPKIIKKLPKGSWLLIQGDWKQK